MPAESERPARLKGKPMPPTLTNHQRYAPAEPGVPTPNAQPPTPNVSFESRALQATLAAVTDPAAKQLLILLLAKAGLLEEG